MPKTGDRAQAPSLKISKAFGRFSESEKRLALLSIAGVLVVIAIAILLLRSQSFLYNKLGSCKSIAFGVQRNQCFSSLANSSSNLSICKLISSPRSSSYCISAIAQRTRNITACSGLERNSSVYAGCIENVSYLLDNPSYCRLLGNNSQSASGCIYSIAELNRFSSISYCSYISNATEESMCTNMYNYNLAERLDAPNYCSMLPNATDNNLVSEMILDTYANKSSNLAYYSFYSLNLTPSGLCYYVIATNSRNQTICSKTTGAISDLCYSNFTYPNQSSNLNISGICSSAPNYTEGLCAYSISTAKALSQRNASICSGINETYYQYSCIVALAARYGNSTYCNSIVGNDSAKSACILSAGANLSNVTG
jgi:hypothetical protein